MAYEPIPPPSNLMAARTERPQLSGMADGLPRTIFAIEQQVRSLAAAVPAAAGEIGQISQLLKAVMMKAVPTGGGSPLTGGAGPGAQPVESVEGY